MKKVLISTIVLLLMFLFIIFATHNSSFRILIRENAYKNTSNTENLVKLCLELSMTEDYEKKIKYFPILLIDANSLNWIKTNISSENKRAEDILDCLQIEYCLTYLMTGKAELFSDEFHRLFNNFKSGTEKYSWLISMVLNGEYETEQLRAILEAVKDAYYLEEQSISGVNNRLSNLNTQIELCDILQDLQGKAIAQEQVDNIIESIK